MSFKDFLEYSLNENCKCQSCGLKYSVDINVPDDLWEKITPKPLQGDGLAGLLCPMCIGQRIESISGYGAYKLTRL